MTIKARRVPDSERTRTMMAALHRKWRQSSQGDATRRALLEEVPPATGFSDGGYSDFLVMNLWESDQRRIIGYEVKASRGDLKKELEDPTKNSRVRALCDEWWLLVWDEKVLAGLDVPAEWGIAMMVGEEGEKVIMTRRKPGFIRTSPEPNLPRAFVAAMLRRALEHAPAAGYVADIVEEARSRAYHAGKSAGRMEASREVWTKVWALLGDLAPMTPDTKVPGRYHRYGDEEALEASVEELRRWKAAWQFRGAAEQHDQAVA